MLGLLISTAGNAMHGGGGARGGNFNRGGDFNRGADYNRGPDYNRDDYRNGAYYDNGWVAPAVVPEGGYSSPCSTVQQCNDQGDCVQTQVCN